MKLRIVAELVLLVCIAGTAFAANNVPSGPQQQTPQLPATIIQMPSQLDNIGKSVTELQNSMKALQTSVAALAKAQSEQFAQLKDMARRLYITCVLVQRDFDTTTLGMGWENEPLCTAKGLSMQGQLPGYLSDLFLQNSQNIDTPFGGP